MSRAEQVTTTCDLHPGDVPAATHHLSLGGTAAEVDLCDEHLKQLGSELAAWVSAARKVRRARRGPGRSAESRHRAEAIRAWGVDRGLVKAGSRGRLPGTVVAEYEAAVHAR